MSEFETASIYVDLDSLFDTRLATIHQFGIEKVAETLKGEYFTRISDEFDGIETELFQKAYQDRNAHTLKNALITPVVELITQFAKQTLIALVSSPFRRQPKVSVNTYPYQLPEEAISGIIAGLRSATNELLDIEVISLSLEEVTPSYIKKNFVMVVMYDYVKWLDIHSENKNLLNTQCPQVMLIAPRLLKSKEVLRQVRLDTAVEALEKHASIFINLMLYPVQTFCVNMDRMKETVKKST